ncbi:MAG: hypothetical protein JWO05_3572 [Gemmatimonadetes bacterium]|nr:hypothetical protein [Gemmatimonadota bacterium]
MSSARRVFAASCSVVVLVAACQRAVSTGSPSPAASAAVAAAPAMPAGVTQASIDEGHTAFNGASCKRCHGLDGTGAANAPSLVSGKWLQSSGEYRDIVRVITNGVSKAEIKDPSHPFGMRPRGGTDLADPAIASIAAYVWSISRGK